MICTTDSISPSIKRYPSPIVRLLAICFTAVILSSNGLAQKFDWAKQFEATSYGLSLAVDVDLDGNVFTTGFFSGTTDFDPGTGVVALSVGISMDVFVSKLDSSGQFVWVRQFGEGISIGAGLDIVTDADGNVYFSGSFTDSADFDPGPGVFTLYCTSLEDAFVCKLDPDGNLVWAKQFAGTAGTRSAIALTLDDQNNCYIGGKFENTTDFDPGIGTNPLTSAGGMDLFVCKLNANGDFAWAKRIGGSQADELRAIDLDNQGNLYCTGNFGGTVDFNPGSGVFNFTATQLDIFVLKLTNNGDFVWAKRMGGSLIEIGNCIKLDDNCNVYLNGHFRGSVDFDPGPGVVNLTANSNFDAYVQKLDSSGAFLWAKRFGSTQDDAGRGLDLDSSGNVYVTGQFMGTVDFDPSPAIHTFSTSGALNDRDIYICKLDPLGNLKWSKHIGGTGASDNGLALCVDAHDKVYTTGTFMHTVDMNTGSGTLLLTSENSLDMFVHKLSPCQMSYGSTTIVHCGNYTSPSGEYQWSSSGTYIDVISNATGCDSVITIDLTIIPLPTRTIQASSCTMYASPSGNHVWTSTGTFYDTLSNPVGCDSLLIVHLTLLQSRDSIVVNACTNYTSPSGLYNWTSSGFYYDTLVHANGCDSILVIDLRIHTPVQSEIDVTTCGSYTSPSGLYTWTSSGVYSDTLTSAMACDSIISINLNLLPVTSSTIEAASCTSYESPSGLYTWTNSGTYSDTLVNVYGCDSLITVELTILTNTFSAITVAACDSMVSPGNNYVWYNSGIYTDTLPNANGCDSVITVNLTIHTVTAGINVLDAVTLQAEGPVGSTFQWLHCDDFSVVEGATSAVFAAQENGNYAVQVTANGCTDTSACVAVTSVGIAEADQLTFVTVSPNPTAGKLLISNPKGLSVANWELLELSGNVVQTGEAASGDFEITVEGGSGMYFLRITFDSGRRTCIPVVRL